MTGDRDPEQPEVDPHPWRAAVVLGLLAIVGGMAASMWIAPALGHNHWWIPGDAWRSLRAAHYVPQGTYPLIYETGTLRDVFDSGPLLPLVLAPVAALGDLLHLRDSYPFPRQHPSMWLAFGPYALASAVPLMYAVRALATQLRIRTGRLFLQIAVLLFAFVPMAIVYGHYEDVLALALVLLAFRDLFADRPLRGALLVAVAIAFKQWSLLAVPVYVAACAPELRRRAAVRTLVPPALFFCAFLVADFKYASFALLHPPAFPLYGHAALWVSPTTDYIADVPTRVGAFAVAFVVAWLIRRERDPGVVLSALGIVLLARFFFEPVVHSYYLAPGLAVLLVAARSVRARIVTDVALGAVLLALFPFHPARLLWWLAVYALGAAFVSRPVLLLVRRVRTGAGRRPSRSAGAPGPDDRAPEPSLSGAPA